MLFSSLSFLILFLPVTVLVCLLLAPRYRNGWLLLTSLFFYGWGEPYCVFLLICSILTNYIFGFFISSLQGRTAKIPLAVGITINLGMLFFYKYFNFTLNIFTDSTWQAAHYVPQILLPIGISFYTFQGISYLMDVYRRECEVQRNPLSFGLYISFFPQLIAGPIIKYHDVAQQLNSREMNPGLFAYGIRRFLYGLSKKIILANTLARFADYTFAEAEITTGEAWLGAFCYLFQIYYDFSGYSDMAIGLAAMFGFRFKENFNYPYLSRSIREFWRRWHISLSTWFKEYVYIPLGGSRTATWKIYRNLFTVFLLTGIWHGANWTFLVWGIFHGSFILLERICGDQFLQRHRVFSHIYTVLTVLIGFVIFRADTISQAWTYLGTMFGITGIHSVVANISSFTLLILGLAIIGCGPLQKLLKVDFCAEKISAWRSIQFAEAAALCLLLAVDIGFLAISSYNPFIYFRF